MNIAKSPVLLYQITWSAQTKAERPSGFLELDNTANERPDWYEYWPIRRFLLGQPLQEDAFYGFFSPRFTAKTELGPEDVRTLVQRHADKADVFLFSPQPDMNAFFLNVFEQGATFDSRLIEVTERLLHPLGFKAPLAQLVMDSRTTVYSNYFVARPAFWRAWLGLTEAVFAVAEGPACELKADLEALTSYRNGVPRKVFIVERMASLLLTLQPKWRTRSANVFDMRWSKSRLADHPTEACLSDALKIAYREHRFPQYLEAFSQLRERVYAAMTAPRQDAA
jgi:hypothetical protein